MTTMTKAWLAVDPYTPLTYPIFKYIILFLNRILL